MEEAEVDVLEASVVEGTDVELENVKAAAEDVVDEIALDDGPEVTLLVEKDERAMVERELVPLVDREIGPMDNDVVLLERSELLALVDTGKGPI